MAEQSGMNMPQSRNTAGDPAATASGPCETSRVYIETLGCQMNKLDAQITLEAFLRHACRRVGSI